MYKKKRGEIYFFVFVFLCFDLFAIRCICSVYIISRRDFKITIKSKDSNEKKKKLIRISFQKKKKSLFYDVLLQIKKCTDISSFFFVLNTTQDGKIDETFFLLAHMEQQQKILIF